MSGGSMGRWWGRTQPHVKSPEVVTANTGQAKEEGEREKGRERETEAGRKREAEAEQRRRKPASSEFKRPKRKGTRCVCGGGGDPERKSSELLRGREEAGESPAGHGMVISGGGERCGRICLPHYNKQVSEQFFTGVVKMIGIECR